MEKDYKSGFTLVELLTIIIILGIVLAIAIPKVLDSVRISKIKSFKTSIQTAFKKITVFGSIDKIYEGRLEDLKMNDNHLVGKWEYNHDTNVITLTDCLDTKYKLAFAGKITDENIKDKTPVEYKIANNNINNYKSSSTSSLGMLLKDYRIYGNSTQATRSGKNLIPSTVYNQTYWYNYSSDDMVFKLNVQAGKIYTLSLNYEKIADSSEYFYIEKYGKGTYSLADGDSKSSISNLITHATVSGNKKVTFAVDDNHDYYLWFWRKSNLGTLLSDKISNIQLEECVGATTLNNCNTDYEEYGKTPSPEFPSSVVSVGETGSIDVVVSGDDHSSVTSTIDLAGHDPLRKIGDVADYIDYENKKVVRKIGKKAFTGEEVLSSSTAISESGYYAYIYNMTTNLGIPATTQDNSPLLCNYYEQNNVFNPLAKNKILSRSNNAKTSYLIYFSVPYSTVESFKSFLREKNSNDNPVTLYYLLPTPIEEDIELPSILTLDGMTTISVEGTTIEGLFYEKK